MNYVAQTSIYSNRDYYPYLTYENMQIRNTTSPNVNIFSDMNLGQDTVSFSSNPIKQQNAPKSDLQAEFDEIQRDQGFIGKTFDWVKNRLDFLSDVGFVGSDELSEIIAQAEAGEISEEEAKKALDNYASNQERGVRFIQNTATTAIVAAALLLSGPLGWGAAATIAVGCAVGVASRVGLGAAEAATNDIEKDYTAKEAVSDAKEGFLIGLTSGVFKAGAMGRAEKLYIKVCSAMQKLMTSLGLDKYATFKKNKMLNAAILGPIGGTQA